MIKIRNILLIGITFIIIFAIFIKNTTYGYKTEDLQKGDILIGDEIYRGYISPNQIVSSAINHYMRWKDERLTIYKYNGTDLLEDHKWLFLQNNNDYKELPEEEINKLELRRYINEVTKKLDVMNEDELQKNSSFKYDGAYYVYANDIKKLGVLSTKNIFGYFVYKNKEILDNKLNIKNIKDLNFEDYKNAICDDLFVKKGYITYEDFYAMGDGIHDDAHAIYYAHECANKLKVPINTKGNYYIHHLPIINNTLKAINIETNVDWNNSKIIIDDNNLSSEERAKWVFLVNRKIVAYDKTISINYDSTTKSVPEILNLIKNNTSVNNFYVGLTSKSDKIYRSNGQENGVFSEKYKSDYFKIDKNGKVYNKIRYKYGDNTRLDVYEIPDETLTIKNGNFITKAYKCLNEKKELTCSGTTRNIRILRSNVIVDNLVHNIIDDDFPTYYSGGFIYALNMNNLTIKNSKFGAHMIKKSGYEGSVGGTYDISMANVSDVTFDNVGYSCEENESFQECYYKNIIDKNYFGITGCNDVKGWNVNNSILNRIDSHQPSSNISVKNSILGYYSVNVTGEGNLIVENSSIDQSEKIVFLRADYGGTWNGNIKLNNIYFNTRNYKGGYPTSARILQYFNTNKFNVQNGGFGYDTYVPSIDASNIFFDELNEINSRKQYSGTEYKSSPGIILVQNTAKTTIEEVKKSVQKSTLVGDMNFNNIRSVTFDNLAITYSFLGNTNSGTSIKTDYIYEKDGVIKTSNPWGVERYNREYFYNNSTPININIDMNGIKSRNFTNYYEGIYYDDGVKKSNNNSVKINKNEENHSYCTIEIKETIIDDWYKDQVLHAKLNIFTPEGILLDDYGLSYDTLKFNKTDNITLTKDGVYNIYGFIKDSTGKRYDCIKLIKKTS